MVKRKDYSHNIRESGVAWQGMISLEICSVATNCCRGVIKSKWVGLPQLQGGTNQQWPGAVLRWVQSTLVQGGDGGRRMWVSSRGSLLGDTEIGRELQAVHGGWVQPREESTNDRADPRKRVALGRVGIILLLLRLIWMIAISMFGLVVEGARLRRLLNGSPGCCKGMLSICKRSCM